MYDNVSISMENTAENLMENIANNGTERRSENSDPESCVAENLRNQSIVKIKKVGKDVDQQSDDEEEIDDPENECRVSVNQTCLETYASSYPVGLVCSGGGC